ncbi:cadherin-99C-like [Pollicipes pollicipes]|uniref:cadherin-99C-like n=1 Tax=Pollicipes pollicipes TaxID=41117 RepID=UPI0018853AFC|nr:cadherin-99C-like [Pollicipes pollicipes]
MAKPVRVTDLLVLLLLLCPYGESQDCGHVDDIFVNNWLETDQKTMKRVTCEHAKSLSAVTMTGQNDTDHFDASEFVSVSVVDPHNGTIEFLPGPKLRGIRDYPSPKAKNTLLGKCVVICGGGSTTFSFTAIIKDANTAQPAFSAPSYALEVVENYPIGVPLTQLTFEASDNDAELQSNTLNFSLSDSTFSLSPPVKTKDWPATYTTQLTLKRALDYAVKKTYRFSITSTDPGGLSATSDVSLTVKDVDNRSPAFERPTYTAEALDPTAVGPLTVLPSKISASDPDTGGPLHYSIQSMQGENWSDYFSIDSDTAVFRLSKVIPPEVPTPDQITLMVQAKETNGPYDCSTVLLVQLVPTKGRPEPESNVGYIIGLAVLGALLLVTVAAAVFIIRRKDRRYRSSHAHGSSKNSLLPGGSQSAAEHGSAPPVESGYTEPSFHVEEPLEHQSYSLVGGSYSQADPVSTLPPLTTSYDPPTTEARSSRGPTLPTIPELHSPRAPTPPPITKVHSPRAPTPPPISEQTPELYPILPTITEPEETAATTIPPIREEVSPPDEPKPDYSLKSVGFKDTVICVTPGEVKELDLKEAKDEDNDGDDDNLEDPDDAVVSDDEGDERPKDAEHDDDNSEHNEETEPTSENPTADAESVGATPKETADDEECDSAL